MDAKELLQTPVKVVNVGLKGFADDLAKRPVPVVHIDWRPPAQGDPKLRELLAKMGS